MVRMSRRLSVSLVLVVLAVGSRAASIQAAPQGAGGAPEAVGPRPEPVDPFHPDRATPATPAWGGTLTMHLESLPASLCGPLSNDTNCRNLLYEVHATLINRDWETWEFVGELARDWELADTIVKRDGEERHGKVHVDTYRATPEAPGVPSYRIDPLDGGTGEMLREEDVERVEKGTVITFYLREGLRWQDGHPLDARDVAFSWEISRIPGVLCEPARPYLDRIERVEVLDEHTVRFFLGEPYFNLLGMFVDRFTILPTHLYDLTDPDNAARPQGRAPTDEERARAINENPHNTQWVGLGPYRVTSYGPEGVETERWDGFFDPANGGYFDRIVWRHVAGDEAARQALLDGRLDFTWRLSSSQYFGEYTAQPAFAEHFIKGYYYLGAFNYVPFNLRREKLADLRVRKALVHAMDMPEFIRTIAHGLALQPTGAQCYFGPSYNHDVQPLPFDLERAAELLAEAGWYDRDGDGLVDRDGQPLELDMMQQAGNAGADIFARIYQENLAKIGVRLSIDSVEWATYRERLRTTRDFDLSQGGWGVDVTENDPAQLWHSSSAVPGGSNHAGVIDPKIDALIEKGNRELDDETRWGLWRQLHRDLYEEWMPYLYREISPRKFGLNRSIRGVQFFKITPGYSVRRWYYPAGTPGTRPTRERK
jgi:peptide/nickel transport system substrate-binding protein